MARITHRLTAIKVANLKAKGLYPDGAGLYLRITSSGTKSWLFRFSRDGATRDMGLGLSPPCPSPEPESWPLRRAASGSKAPTLSRRAGQGGPRRGLRGPRHDLQELCRATDRLAGGGLAQHQAPSPMAEHTLHLRLSRSRRPAGRSHRYNFGHEGARTVLDREATNGEPGPRPDRGRARLGEGPRPA